MSGLEADVWPMVAPQGTNDPYAVYFLTREPERSQDGVELWIVRMRLECYGNDLDDVIALAAVFEADLDIKDETALTEYTLHVSYLESESDDYLHTENKFNISQEYTLKLY
jgi:hypothetical protein